jgi:hypothetical protein
MTDLVFAVTVCVAGRIVLFTVSLVAHRRWKVPVQDLVSLLRATVPATAVLPGAARVRRLPRFR